MSDTRTDTSIAAALLQLDAAGENRFVSRYNQNNQIGMMFGGQLLAQGLAAAKKTVAQWAPHNCNTYFLSRGSLDEPVHYQVECVRDGKRFATRRVIASQGGQPILDMLCSFHDAEAGVGTHLHHQANSAPDVPMPEAVLTERAFMQANAGRLPPLAVEAYCRPFPVEISLLDADQVFFDRATRAERNYWIRMPSAAGLADESQHVYLLAFLSDFRLGGVTVAPHIAPAEVERIIMASLNHSMWFHRPARVDEWLLYLTDSPWSGEGRGMARGTLYNRSGQLVATVMQELVIGLR